MRNGSGGIVVAFGGRLRPDHPPDLGQGQGRATHSIFAWVVWLARHGARGAASPPDLLEQPPDLPFCKLANNDRHPPDLPDLSVGVKDL